METETILLFGATVLPLICTPGPDMLFVTSQVLAGGASSGLRTTAGVCLGYVVHSLLVAFGVAAIVAASPVLFEALRWFGVGYLIWLAVRLIRSALRPGEASPGLAASGGAPLRRGFLTAVLNPKGMLIYFAILPQFIHGGGYGGGVVVQALILSAIFIALCGIVYGCLSMALGVVGRRCRFSDRRRRGVEGVAGGLLIVAAGRLALT